MGRYFAEQLVNYTVNQVGNKSLITCLVLVLGGHNTTQFSDRPSTALADKLGGGGASIRPR